MPLPVREIYRKVMANASFSMNHKLGIYIVWDLSYHDQGRRDNLFGIEGWEEAKELGGAILVSE
jgi:hypothetical protein